VRIRITQQPTGTVDGIDLSKFLEGLSYDVGTTLANYLMAQRWAVPVNDSDATAVLSLNRTIQHPGVLVVEDDEDMRHILTQLLEHHGWRAFAAGDGIEGLDALKRHRPSLILLDLAMPRMNGVEFRQAQQQLPDKRLASVPVVVVSAVHDAFRYKAPLKAADVLVKPFEVERLLQTVETHARPANLFRW
jgi:CheY-like chemotaxis protein